MQVRLVERARAGDYAAFCALIDLQSDRCYALAYRILRDIERAQDAVEQTFLVAWRDLPQLRDPHRFEPWLHRLLVRACYVEARRFRGWSSQTRAIEIDPAIEGDFTSGVADRDAIVGRFEACRRSSAPSWSCITTWIPPTMKARLVIASTRPQDSTDMRLSP